ncbi:RNA polymerase sigma factor [Telmatospirillum siberiense]|uniref:RNA polymerase subunit sigma-70 n=1 Tax=Telmatospirillum siberiense TaxID=382514 RepID=A0A2N3PRP0_9PROT|nr:sigma-70 family RNA polymerase sigma factor [Telmatospirillum siberiense]PKU23066.1 RNA polymerase subunit sigma-70 [Telmatospirillum siberiense]
MSDFQDFLANLYARHSHAFRRLVSSRLLVEADAEDVVQDAFVRILAMDCNIPIASPVGLLARIVSNIVTDRYRADKVRGRHVEYDCEWETVATKDANPEENTEAYQLCRLLQQTIENLPHRCREVFVLHRFDGLSHEEIAKRLGVSRNMVEKHIIRALVDLRKCYDAFDQVVDK